jgi:hypothetical protein
MEDPLDPVHRFPFETFLTIGYCQIGPIALIGRRGAP